MTTSPGPRRRFLVIFTALLAVIAGVAAPSATAAPGTLTWTTPVNPDPQQGQLISVSCPTAAWCVAVDETGHALRYSGGTWHAPVAVEGPYPDGGLVRVSCGAAASCFAVDSFGRVSRGNGTSWSAPALLPGGHSAGVLSCPSATFCLSVGASATARWSGGAWSLTRSPLPRDADFVRLSCSNASFCALTYYLNGHGNYARRYVSGSWTSAVRVSHHGGSVYADVACTSSLFCMAVGDQGHAARWSHGRWSELTIGDSFWATSISCTAWDYCAALGERGNVPYVAFWDGHGWGHQQRVALLGMLRSISCGRGSRTCVAVDDEGYVVRHSSGRWVPRQRPDPTHGFLTDVDCPSTTSCVAVDRAGYAVSGNGSTWGRPLKINRTVDTVRYDELSQLECPTVTFCLTVDTAGYARSRVDGSWHDAGRAPLRVVQLSCATRWCLAANDLGQMAFYDGRSWSARRSLPQDVQALSCVTGPFCVAVDARGAVYRYAGHGWTSAAHLGDGSATAVSCVSPKFCIASGQTWNTWTWNGAKWRKVPFTWQGPTALSCGSPTFCVGTAYDGLMTFDGTSWSDPQELDLGGGWNFDHVSCTAARTCAATTPDRAVFVHG